MGFFSWKTQDTDRSICNNSGDKETFTVYMVDNDNNVWTESDYDGYGEFGGKDFYELLAEMNGLTTREEGISLRYSDKPFLSPNLYEYPSRSWEDSKPEDCEYQGYFYDDDYEYEYLDPEFYGEEA